MAKLPEWRRWGWKPHGPGYCKCPHCGGISTTNALGRARHICPDDKKKPDISIADRVHLDVTGHLPEDF